MSRQSFAISSNFPKQHEKKCKFSDQSVDALLRLPNTSPNTEVVVHRYSIKQLIREKKVGENFRRGKI